MNLIQCDEKKVTLSEINEYCKHKENLVIVDNENSEGIVVMNKRFLEKIALSSFLSEGLTDIEQDRLIDGNEFFDNLERRLSNG